MSGELNRGSLGASERVSGDESQGEGAVMWDRSLTALVIGPA